MKKILMITVLAAFAYAGCKKKDNSESIVVTKSVPTVTITGNQYVSIPVGGSFTPPSATAYDSFYNESLTVLTDLSSLDPTTAGLYVVTYSAKNKYGYIGSASVYVAVTNVSDTLNLSGYYIRSASPGRVAFVTKKARGLFVTSNVGGVDTSDATTGPVVSAVFAVLSPATIDFGTQQVLDNGTLTSLTASTDSLSLTPGDTTLNYAISEVSFGTQLRTFVKQ